MSKSDGLMAMFISAGLLLGIAAIGIDVLKKDKAFEFSVGEVTSIGYLIGIKYDVQGVQKHAKLSQTKALLMFSKYYVGQEVDIRFHKLDADEVYLTDLKDPVCFLLLFVFLLTFFFCGMSYLFGTEDSPFFPFYAVGMIFWILEGVNVLFIGFTNFTRIQAYNLHGNEVVNNQWGILSLCVLVGGLIVISGILAIISVLSTSND